MNVHIRLFAIFREGRFKTRDVELPEDSSPADLLTHLEIPEKQVGILLVNGRPAPVKQTLSADDVVSIFPAIGGG